MAKTISKGVIDPATYAADGCEGVLTFGLGMISVLAGTGSTTLLATLYGLPISASHGVIGGLVAVGLASHGAESLGWEPLEQTVIAWVASPLLGGVTAALLHALIHSLVHSKPDPERRAQVLQPFFVAATVAVAIAFILITGPSIVKVRPVSLAVLISCVGGVAVALVSMAIGRKGQQMQMMRSMAGPSQERKAIRRDGMTSPELSDAESAAAGEQREAEASMAAGSVLDQAGDEAEKPFVPLLILSAMTVAFAHGGNDVGNSIGPLATILDVVQGGDITAVPEIQWWVLLLGSCGFVVGIVLIGNRTIATVGGKITTLTPSRSFAVQTGTAVAVLSSTVLGLAVSTSHCLVGAVIGVGIAGRLLGTGGELNASMLKKIVIGWAATIPLAMLVSLIFFYVLSALYKGVECS